MVNNKKGFTLVELLVTIAIIGVLTVLAVPIVTGITAKARLGKDENVARDYTNAIDVWMQSDVESDEIITSRLRTDYDYSIVEKIGTSQYTEIEYTTAYAGTKQFPGVEYNNEDDIRKCAIAAIKSTMSVKTHITGGKEYISHPNSNAYGFKYYYKVGLVKVEKRDGSVGGMTGSGYQFYIWLDTDDLPSISLSTEEKVDKETSEILSDKSTSAFRFEFGTTGNEYEPDVTFEISSENMSYTLSGKTATPVMFTAGKYHIIYRYCGEIKGEGDYTISESDFITDVNDNNCVYLSVGYKDLSVTNENNFTISSSGNITKYTGNDKYVFVPKTVNGITVTGISYMCFNNLSSLVYISLPDSIMNLSYLSFYNCPNLEVVDMYPCYICCYAINYCPNLRELNIQENLNNINQVCTFDSNCIYGPNNLTSLVLPYTTKIYNSCFSGTNFTIIVSSPNGIYNIYNNTYLTTETQIKNSTYANGKIIFKYTNCQFFKNSGSSSIGIDYLKCTMYDGIDDTLSIPIVYNTTKLPIFAQTNGEYKNSDYKTFSKKIKHLSFQEGFQVIGDNSFRNYTNLSDLELPKSLLIIGKYAFFNTSINAVTLEKNITRVNDYAFQSDSLHSIIIRCNVSALSEKAFDNCLGVRTITIYGFDEKTDVIPEDKWGAKNAKIIIYN